MISLSSDDQSGSQKEFKEGLENHVILIAYYLIYKKRLESKVELTIWQS